MKQFFTIEAELEAIKRASDIIDLEKEVAFSDSLNDIDYEFFEPLESLSPDPLVIQNIVNYARSLEVLKPSTATPMFILKN
ncbi:MAG TPA: hypothetical protein VLH61_03030 [Bacteroidales bacterium]|nr:hypothetical protein [Bacteroidales bacterium]